MKKLLGVGCLLAWVAAPAGPASGFSQPNGALGSFGGIGCSPCHGGEPGPALDVVLVGPTTISPGGVASFTAFIDPLGVGGGIDIAIDEVARGEGWMLDTDDPGLGPVTSGNLIHVNGLAPAPNGNIGDWSYDFVVVAPEAPGMLELRVAMMAFDGDGDNNPADLWNATSILITVPEPTRAPAHAAWLVPLLALAWAANRYRAPAQSPARSARASLKSGVSSPSLKES